MPILLEERGRSRPGPGPGATTPRPPTRVPFTVLDEVIHLLDTPSEPWSIEYELEVPGRIDDVRLDRAVQEALARHPMARARLMPTRRTDRRWHWEITPRPQLDPLKVVEARTDDELADVRRELQSLDIPLVESPPLRMRLVHAPDGDRVMLNANHAAFDGVGCMRFLQSVGRAYTGAVDPPTPVSLTHARDVGRHLSAHEPAVRAHRLQALADQACNLLRAPARIAPAGGTDQAGYGIVHGVLSEHDSKSVRQSDLPGTVNDLLLAALHLAIERWNDEHDTRTGWITVFMPVNLRPRQWSDDVVTNFVLLSSVSTAARHRASTRAVVGAIRDQTQLVKRWGTGAALYEVLNRFPLLPLWVKQALPQFLWLTGNRLVDTALLTNLGEIEEPPSFGDEVGPTEGAWLSAPARMPCGLSVGAVTLAGRLHLSFRHRLSLLGENEAQQFADRYVEQLLGMVSS